MKEYPPGCLLVLKQELVPAMVWGEHYVIEYNGNRVIREVQPAEDSEQLLAYATDESTYNDGRQKYPALKISKTDISQVWLVLGHIAKRFDS